MFEHIIRAANEAKILAHKRQVTILFRTLSLLHILLHNEKGEEFSHSAPI